MAFMGCARAITGDRGEGAGNSLGLGPRFNFKL